MPGVFHKGSASHDRNDDSGVDDSVDWCQEYVATGLSINDECNLIDYYQSFFQLPSQRKLEQGKSDARKST
jgi:hypothetical protein